MTAPSRNERDLFAALTMTLMAMKDASYAQVQVVVEEHFRNFLLLEGASGPGALQITWTCSLPEGPGSFAIYRTEYDTQWRPRPSVASARALAAKGSVVPFPRRSACADPQL